MILCWFFRHAIAHRCVTDEPMSPRIHSHLQQCSSCRAFYRLQTQVSERLIAEAPAELQAPSPFFQGRMMAALNRPARTETVPPRSWTPVWLGGLVALGVAVAASLLLQNGKKPTELAMNSKPEVEPSAAVDRLIGSLNAAANTPNGVKLRQWSQQLDQPLEAELNSVVHDAQQALDLLAQNFLPTQFRASIRREAGN